MRDRFRLLRQSSWKHGLLNTHEKGFTMMYFIHSLLIGEYSPND